MDVPEYSLFYTSLFRYFRYIGLSPDGQSSTKFLTMMLIFWILHSICAQSYYVISNVKTLDDLIKNGTKLIQIFGLMMKLSIYWVKENEIRSLVCEINLMIKRRTHTSAIRHFQKLDSYINRCFKFYSSIGFVSFVSVAIFKPFGLLFQHYFAQNEWDFSKSFPNLWLHDSTHLIAWYPWFVCMVAWTVFAIVVCDLMILGLCVQSYALYECLIDDFKSFDNILGTGLAIRAKDGLAARGRMREIIWQHVEVIETLDKISDISGPLIMLQLITGMLDVTLYMYGTHLDSATLVGILLLSTYQLFIYCYGGSIVQIMSDKFSREIYNTNWYNYPLWAQKGFLMIVMMATRTRYVSVYHFKCDLVIFKNILNIGYSIYACLAHLRRN